MKSVLKHIWKSRLGKAWIFTTGILAILMVAIMIITTQVSLIYGTLNLVFDGERLDTANAYNLYGKDEGPYFKPDQATKGESVAANLAVAEQINEQGIVLLKNDDNALPLTKDTPKVSVFGKNSVNMVYGGTGSGGRSADASLNLYDALEGAGIEYNDELKRFYDDNSRSGGGRPKSPNMGDILTGFPIGETPKENYTETLVNTYSGYNDAAIIVLTRIGGEGYDLPRSMFWNGSDYKSWSGTQVIPGAFSMDSHYLELDRNEADLIAHVCDNFDNVIIVLNCGTSMELGFLDSSEFWTEHGYEDYSAKINAAIWAGNPGEIGNKALAKIIKGEVNPSGRTVDTFVRDFTKDPTWYNFGNNIRSSGNEYYLGAEGTSVNGHTYFVNYEEGIYAGYRYWETRGYTEDDDYDWYNENVVYPFGYGLSYDYNFHWEILSCNYSDGSAIDADDLKKDGTIEIKVKVTNNGTVPGRDVVQLYYSPQYWDGEVEKAHVNLADFAKTKIIAPGGEDFDEVTLTLKVADMASYDWNDANNNGHKGYELDEGDYVLYIARNAHDHSEDETLQVAFYVNGGDFTANTGTQGFKYDQGARSAVENRFDDVSYGTSKGIDYVSRADFEGTVPTSFPYERGLNVYQANEENIQFFNSFNLPADKNANDLDKPWYVPEDKKPATGRGGNAKLTDMIGKPYDHEDWNKLLDQLTVNEMNNLIGIGAFATQQVGSVEKPKTQDWDGPGGFVVGSFMSLTGEDSTVVCFWPCESLIASTWSKELAKDMGNALGNEGLWGSNGNDATFNSGYTYSGWYAPAVNIHRSQFGGRNFEYYSEDPLLSGKIAANVCKGARDKGLITYVKHFAFNDQETNRSDNGYAVWASEQSLREIYLKPFEYAVKEGETLGMMTSFNRIGTTWTGASYALLTEILRNEWGFDGVIITDYNNGAGSYMDLDMMIRAGGNLNLFQSTWLSVGAGDLTATHLTAMRNACHDILYATANSMAMNNPFGPMLLPVWVITMYCVCAGIFACLAGWGVFVVLRAVKASKKEQSDDKE